MRKICTALVEVVNILLKAIASQMSQVQSHPYSSLERSQQRHEDSAS
jgi:hypothetical protein